MYKRTIVKTTFCLALLMISLSTFAQTRILEIPDDGVDPIFYPTDVNGNATVTTPVFFIANLSVDQNTFAPLSQLPPGTAPLFLEFTIEGDDAQLIPITNFTYETQVNGHSVFRMVPVDFTANFNNFCSDSANSGKTGFTYSFRLTTADGSDYPIHDTQYSNPDGIFSCEVFELTQNDCINKSKLFIISGFNNSVMSNFPGEVICPDLWYRSGSGSNLKQFEVNVTPNPFQGNIQLEYHLKKEGPVNITFFNTQGQTMLEQIEKGQSKGFYQSNFDTQNWINGIYFCRIQTSDTVQTIKLIKTQ